jgi:glycosyltransferase involved in cell wall biosynthesis
MRRVIIHWGISSFFGWGVYGLNLALNWAGDPEIEAFNSFALAEDQIAVDRLRRRALDPFIRRSTRLVADLAKHPGRTINIDLPVLMALGNDFRSSPAAHGVHFVGSPDVGVVFFEIPQMDAETIARARALPLIVTGSTWNERILREYGLADVTTVIQGIDPTLFHPAPRLGRFADRFLVFSGGKLELRKGQDLVVAAFARFAKDHPEALLVSAWHSPWPQFARTLDQSGRAAPIVFDAAGKVDATGWAAANGIAEDQFVDLGAVPNAFMPPILREMDAALFPNRSEGGTNLVAMECMACGVPTVLSANTGHLDLIEDGVCLPLTRQSAVAGAGAAVGGTPGWGDSSVDEIVARLEEIHADRERARAIGLAGAEKLGRLTWARTAAEMKRIVLSLA